MFRDSTALRRGCVCLLVLFSMTTGSTARGDSPLGIRTGLVLIDGQFIAAPYIVNSEGFDVTINGHSIGHVSGAKTNGFPFEDSPANTAIAQVERLLLQDGVLLKQNDAVLLLPGMNGYDTGALLMHILETLAGNQTEDEILRSLSEYDDPALYHMTTRRWSEIIALFKTNPALGPQLADSCGIVPLEETCEINSGTEDVLEASITKPGNIAESVQYGVNLFGMLAGVAALGSLLSLRPNTERRWLEMNASVSGLKLVARCGSLIMLLGLFDLVCTLMALHTGMFRELNPFASQVSNNPLLIIAFKATAMAVGVGLLWRLRRYSGAQTAAWWMCLVCTLVVFRWLTFHSMFIA